MKSPTPRDPFQCCLPPNQVPFIHHPSPPSQGSWEDLPFLCADCLVLKNKFNKICLVIFLRFPFEFYLEEPKNPKTDNTLLKTKFHGVNLKIQLDLH